MDATIGDVLHWILGLKVGFVVFWLVVLILCRLALAAVAYFWPDSDRIWGGRYRFESPERKSEKEGD